MRLGELTFAGDLRAAVIAGQLRRVEAFGEDRIVRELASVIRTAS